MGKKKREAKKDWAEVIDVQDYLARVVGIKGQVKGDQFMGLCPLHDDKTSSFSMSLSKGLWKCFSGCGQGNLPQFHAKWKDCLPVEAEEELELVAGVRKEVPPKEVNDRHKTLLAKKDALEDLKKKRGLTLETIKRFKLGFDGKRIWIPIMERGIIWNVKQHRAKDNIEPKALSYDQNMGEARLFPYDNLKHDQVVIFEGEFDAMLAHQLGIHAITNTAGAETWKNKFNGQLKGKDVVICYDIDKAGKDGAAKVARILFNMVKSLKVVDLPINTPPKGDFSDYILKHGHTAKDFKELVEDTPEYKMGGSLDQVAADATPMEVTLGKASDASLYFKKIKMSVTISGKDLTPFHAPKKIQLVCPLNQGEKCANCPMLKSLGNAEIVFGTLSQDVLKLIKVNDEEQSRFIRKKAGIPQCGAWTWQAVDVFRVEELRAIPEVTFSDLGNPYVTRTIYSVADREIKSNQSYVMEGITVPEPDNQYVTQIISNAQPVKSSVELFKMSRDVERELTPFKVRRGGKVADKMADLCLDLTTNVTKIYQREDVMTAALLTYCSPRQFVFNDEVITKGWLESLIIGDTRTGKTKTIERLMKEIRLGELITGENLSFAGLVGGMTQAGNRWHLTWGKLPLNNGGLVVVDETSGIHEDIIGNLSGIRSSGVAEITKIQTERTEAQTRIIWLSNPRSGGKMDGHSYGIYAVKELFVKAEDIARLDLVVSVASNEVDINLINSVMPPPKERKYGADALSHLVLWAWSRKRDQVIFNRKSIDAAMEAAKMLGRKYSAAIPVVEAAEQRIKVARVAAAAAALTFSTEDGERLDVTPDHVEWAGAFMDQCFSKASLGYDLFSVQAIQNATVDDVTKELIKGQFVSFEGWKIVQKILLSTRTIRRGDLEAQLGYDRDQSRTLFQWFGKWGLMASGGTGFRPSPVFTRILRELQYEKPPKPIGINQGRGKDF